MPEGGEKVEKTNTSRETIAPQSVSEELAAERQARGMPVNPGDTVEADLNNAGQSIKIERLPDGGLVGEVLPNEET